MTPIHTTLNDRFASLFLHHSHRGGGWGTSVLASSLTGTLSHLSSAASESSHALLSPLGTHATLDVEEERDDIVLHEAARKGAGLKGASVLHNALQRGGDELTVLDGGLKLVQGGVLVDGDGERLLKGSDKDLHFVLPVARTR
jgi:hypothetical protein